MCGKRGLYFTLISDLEWSISTVCWLAQKSVIFPEKSLKDHLNANLPMLSGIELRYRRSHNLTEVTQPMNKHSNNHKFMASTPIMLVNDCPSYSYTLRELVGYIVQIELAKKFAFKQIDKVSCIPGYFEICYVVEGSLELMILKIPPPLTYRHKRHILDS